MSCLFYFEFISIEFKLPKNYKLKNKKNKKHMNKVIIIGAIPNMVNVAAILRNTMTEMSHKAEIIIDNTADSSKEFSDTLATIMEILGLGELPDIKLIEDMKSIEREFKMKEESIIELTKNAEKIKILKEEGPWYNRFYKPVNHSRINDKYKSFKPQTKKKGTRKK